MATVLVVKDNPANLKLTRMRQANKQAAFRDLSPR